MNPIQAIAAPSSPTAAGVANDAAVSKEEFLILLVAQLQHQDPLSPQDPSEFTAQLAQFSSLEQLISVNQSINDLADLEALNAMIGATNMIGQEATVIGDALNVEGGTASEIGYSLSRPSASTHVNIYDANGAIIHIIDLGPQAAGDHATTWDGLLDNGEAALDGQYSFEITAVDEVGLPITTLPSFRGLVTGVTFEQGTVMVEVGGVKVPIGNLLGIGSPSAG